MTDDLATVGERRLKAAGKQITPQRKLILDTLVKADRHLDASEIYESVRREDGRLSPATVYRTLNVLKIGCPLTAPPCYNGFVPSDSSLHRQSQTSTPRQDRMA